MRPLLCAVLLLLAACAAPQQQTPATTPEAVAGTPPPRDLAAAITAPDKTKDATIGVVDTTCKTDADCVVKDVGNCCGYYPQCVNAASPTFADQVKAQCAKDGKAGVCGFPSIAGCSCVAGKCAAQAGASGDVH